MSHSFRWHFQVHRRFGERLKYYFLGFGATYERGRIFTAISEFLASKGIKGYSIAEVFGPLDLIVSIWVPLPQPGSFETISPGGDAFDDAFRGIFGTHLDTFEPFEATESTIHHLWLVDRRARTFRRPPLPPQIQFDEIAKIQDAPDSPFAQSYLDSDLFRQSKGEDGIRFTITIPPPRTSIALLGRLADTVIGLLLEMDSILDPVVYLGIGGHVWLLIEARVEPQYFFSIGELISELNNQAGVANYRVKTTTYLCTSTRDAFVSTDDIFIPGAETEELVVDLAPAPETFLDKEESDALEIKASTKTDFRVYLERRRAGRSDGLIHHNKALTDEVLRSVTAFLNTAGGHLLLGAVALKDYGAPEREIIEQDFSKVGRYHICGIEWDYGSRGYDVFATTLIQVIGSRIDKSVRVRAHKAVVANRDVCIVEVPPGRDWFYLDNVFYVRIGSSDVPLYGLNQQQYQRRNPRR